MTRRIPRWREIRTMTDRLADQRRASEERTQAAEALLPLVIPPGKRVIEVSTTELHDHNVRLDITVVPDAEIITRAGDASAIYAMSVYAASLMQGAAQS